MNNVKYGLFRSVLGRSRRSKQKVEAEGQAECSDVRIIREVITVKVYEPMVSDALMPTNIDVYT